MEIERKFVVLEIPEHLEHFAKQHIEQAYLSTDPVIRIRRKNDEYILTCKGRGLLVREEYEQRLSKEDYCRLLRKAEGQIVIKDRYLIPYEQHVIELDVFQEPLAPLCIAEVEFDSVEDAAAFQPPDWFGEDVTEDPAYTNAALSRGMTEIEGVRKGRYRHFKGNEYEVVDFARHSETEELMVVYRALYGEEGLWVRPISMWNELVTRDGIAVPRFSCVEKTIKNIK